MKKNPSDYQLIHACHQLNDTEKNLLTKVNSLDKGDGCFASNAYLGRMLNKSTGRIANIISSLRKRGFIQDVAMLGNKRYIRLLKSRLVEVHENVKVSPPPTLTKTLSLPSRKREPHLHENVNVYIKYKKEKTKELTTLPDGTIISEHQPTKKSQTEQTQMTGSANGIYSEPTTSVPKIFENIFIKTSIPSNPKKKMALPPKPLKKTSVETVTPKKEKTPMVVIQDHVDVYEVYKANIYPVARKNMSNIVQGIPLALKMFKEDYGDKAKEKLIEALTALGKQYDSDPYWIKKVNAERGIFWRAPKHVFSKGHIENTLLNLSYEIKSNEQPNRHLVKTSTTEEERRERQAANKKNIDYLISLGNNNPK